MVTSSVSLPNVKSNSEPALLKKDRQFDAGELTVSLSITDLPCTKLKQPEGQPPLKYRSIGYDVKIAPLAAERLPGHVCASVQQMDKYSDPYLQEKFTSRGLKDALYATIRILSPLGYSGRQNEPLSEAENEGNGCRTKASLERVAEEIYGGVVERVLDDFARLGCQAVCVPSGAADAKLADFLMNAGFEGLPSGALVKFFSQAGNIDEISIRRYPDPKTGVREYVTVNATNLAELIRRDE